MKERKASWLFRWWIWCAYFSRCWSAKKKSRASNCTHELFTVAQMIAQLRGQILASADNSVNLVQFFEACPSRHAMIVAFLAVLEMVKLQAVLLAQEKQFGDILIKKAKAFDVAFDEIGGAADRRGISVKYSVLSLELSVRRVVEWLQALLKT